MPKWVFYHTAGSFTAEEKRQIAQGMTKIYTSVGLPAFYCHTHFIGLEPENIYAGGENPPALTTIAIHHVARSLSTNELEDMFFQGLDDVLRPILKPKNMEWECAIYEGSLEYWRVNGLIPPAMGSDLEKKWFKENRVTDEEQLLKNQPRP